MTTDTWPKRQDGTPKRMSELTMPLRRDQYWQPPVIPWYEPKCRLPPGAGIVIACLLGIAAWAGFAVIAVRVMGG